MVISHRKVTFYTLFLLFVGILHHTDHILRYDHSGWPFRPEVTPFTFSLLVYPVIFSLFAVKNKKYRIIASTILAILVIGAHIFMETPLDQFNTWANNSSSFPYSLGHPNLLNVESPLLGVIAVIIAIVLNIGALILPFVFYKESDPKEAIDKNSPL